MTRQQRTRQTSDTATAVAAIQAQDRRKQVEEIARRIAWYNVGYKNLEDRQAAVDATWFQYTLAASDAIMICEKWSFNK